MLNDNLQTAIAWVVVFCSISVMVFVGVHAWRVIEVTTTVLENCQ